MALTASRASYIGGCASTSNVLGGKLYGIPVAGLELGLHDLKTKLILQARGELGVANR